MTTNALAMKTVGELRQLAASMGIRRANDLKKHQLISALDDRRANPVPPVFGKERPSWLASSTMTVKEQPTAPSTYPVPAPPPVGLPIPDQYGTNRLVLMPQDPHRLFVYWMVNAEQMNEIQHAFQHKCHPVLLLMSNGGIEQREIELRSGNAYLSVIPKCSYRSALAIRDIDGTIHHLITSNHVTMPSDSYGPEADMAEMNVYDPFYELYELAAMTKRVPSGSSRDRLEDRDSKRMPLNEMLPLGASSTSMIRH